MSRRLPASSSQVSTWANASGEKYHLGFVQQRLRRRFNGLVVPVGYPDSSVRDITSTPRGSSIDLGDCRTRPAKRNTARINPQQIISAQGSISSFTRRLCFSGPLLCFFVRSHLVVSETARETESCSRPCFTVRVTLPRQHRPDGFLISHSHRPSLTARLIDSTTVQCPVHSISSKPKLACGRSNNRRVSGLLSL